MEKQQMQFLVDVNKPIEEIQTVILNFLHLYPDQRHEILSAVQRSVTEALNYYKGVD